PANPCNHQTKVKVLKVFRSMFGPGAVERGLLRGAKPLVRASLPYRTKYLVSTGIRTRALVRLTAQLAVVALLLCLAVANIYVRSTWSEPEDGVLWATTPDGVVAREIARDSPASQAGIQPGDILAQI